MADDRGDGSDESVPAGRLDVPTLRILARRAGTHPLVDDWAFEPSRLSPRSLRLIIDASAYPGGVVAARVDVRWFNTRDYSFHYLETRTDGDSYQCRWDRHPKTSAPRTHFHPPQDAGDAEPSSLELHHLDVLFHVLDWIAERVEQLHG